jgi:sugar/nucleoside kinase (ribokinase family)
MDGEVLVIGDLLLDVVVSPDGPMRNDGDVLAAVRLLPGGGGGNLAIRLARRGRRVRLVAPLGDDLHGRMLRAACATDEVTLDALAAPSSGVVVVLVDRDGRRSMLSDRASSPAVPAIGNDMGAIVCSGYALAGSTGGELASRLDARRPGCLLVIVGAAIASTEAARELTSRISGARPDLVVCNRDEAAGLIAAEHEAEPSRLAGELGARLGTLAIVTDPQAGSAASRSDAGRIPRVEADGAPRDSTGAGDAYVAALVDGLLDGPWPPTSESLDAAMRAGAALAAEVVTVVGAQTRVPLEGAAPIAAHER